MNILSKNLVDILRAGGGGFMSQDFKIGEQPKKVFSGITFDKTEIRSDLLRKFAITDPIK